MIDVKTIREGQVGNMRYEFTYYDDRQDLVLRIKLQTEGATVYSSVSVPLTLQQVEAYRWRGRDGIINEYDGFSVFWAPVRGGSEQSLWELEIDYKTEETWWNVAIRCTKAELDKFRKDLWYAFDEAAQYRDES
jgi:hypothetical protein